MVYKGLIRKRKIEQQEQNFQILTMVYKALIRNRKIEQQEQSFSEINNGLQSTNHKT